MLSKRMRDMLFGNNGTGRTFLHFVLLLLCYTLLYFTLPYKRAHTYVRLQQ